MNLWQYPRLDHPVWKMGAIVNEVYIFICNHKNANLDKNDIYEDENIEEF